MSTPAVHVSSAREQASASIAVGRGAHQHTGTHTIYLWRQRRHAVTVDSPVAIVYGTKSVWPTTLKNNWEQNRYNDTCTTTTGGNNNNNNDACWAAKSYLQHIVAVTIPTLLLLALTAAAAILLAYCQDCVYGFLSQKITLKKGKNVYEIAPAAITTFFTSTY